MKKHVSVRHETANKKELEERKGEKELEELKKQLEGTMEQTQEVSRARADGTGTEKKCSV